MRSLLVRLGGAAAALALAAGQVLICTTTATSAAAPSCVVKLQFSSSDQSDNGTDNFVKGVLSAQGYKVIDDWLFTIWSHSDYEVKVNITHTEFPNNGFPVDYTGIHLFIADSSGKVFIDDFIDRANLGPSLQSWIPACNAPSPQ
jgi:hypothetical protein